MHNFLASFLCRYETMTLDILFPCRSSWISSILDFQMSCYARHCNRDTQVITGIKLKHLFTSQGIKWTRISQPKANPKWCCHLKLICARSSSWSSNLLMRICFLVTSFWCTLKRQSVLYFLTRKNLYFLEP